MVLAVTTVSDIVHVVASFFAEESGTLGTGDMKSLFASCTVAWHTGPCRGSTLSTLLLAQVASLEITVCGHQAQDNRFHGGNIAEPHFRNIECTNDMGPTVRVGPL